LWFLLIYTGKDATESSHITPDMNKTTATVIKLTEVLKEGRTVWMDNFYNSSTVAIIPKSSYRTGCMGTLKGTGKMSKRK
jgi:hypothetical protein